MLLDSSAATDNIVDPKDAAESAGLIYVSDEEPGIRRKKAGTGFTYVLPNGRKVDDKATLERIRSLAIPPAYTDVWICANPRGHLQATGRDAKGRKQYRYHPKWRAVRDEVKYERMINFGQALPTIRKEVDRALSLPGMPREKMLATIVYLLEATMMRVGNEEYARTNKSFGLTTLRNRHVGFLRGGRAKFAFRGKSGLDHEIVLDDAKLVRLVKRCQQLPGQALFQYVDDDGQQRPIESSDVNEYLREVTEQDFTAKDFRTWGGTVTAAELLAPLPVPDTEKEAKSNELIALDAAADRLGNTRTVCRNCYVHPHISTAYREGDLQEAWKRARTAPRFSRAERATLTVLEQRV